MKINLDKKVFVPVANSTHGEVSSETRFVYTQKGNLVTAKYKGDSIEYGKIIAKQLVNNDLEMLYQCITTSGELRAGKAYAKVTLNEHNQIQMDLDWQWLNGD